MPFWTIEEVSTISSLYSVAPIVWKTRFESLGGVPRLVLEKTHEDAHTILTTACGTCSLDNCIWIVPLQRTNVAHTLVHLHFEHPFTLAEPQYVSVAVIKTIVRLKYALERQKMLDMLVSAGGDTLTTALRAYIFLPYALEMLGKGRNVPNP